MLWRRQLAEQQLLQIHPASAVPNNVCRYVYPTPPIHQPRAVYPSIQTARNFVQVDQPSREPRARDVHKSEVLEVPVQAQQQPTPAREDESALPKLTIEKLKSCIKPIDRHSNHEIDLPKELEPYFGKGWTCRYYHSTPAWGFIPPKGSGMRRADGFKALMTRLDLLNFRKKQSRAVGKTVRALEDVRAINNVVQSTPSHQESTELLNQGTKRKRVCEVSRVPSRTILIDHQGITIKKTRLEHVGDVACIQQRDEVNLYAASSVQSSISGSSPETVPHVTSTADIFEVKTISSTDSQDLPHQVTFETKLSNDECSAGPPKKRFLRRNEYDSSSGIGLLAHVASFL